MAQPTVVEFHGEPAGSAPLTWGQRNMRRASAENPPGHFNLSRVVAAPRRATVDVAQAGTAVAILLRRHESLRTVYPAGPAGARQEVLGSGRLELAVAQCGLAVAQCGNGPDHPGSGLDRAAEQLRQELARPPFADETELPVRVGLVTAGGQVRRVVLVVSHLAADATALDVLERELRLLLLRGGVATAAGLQPRQLAAREQATGSRLSDGAVAHWEGLFRRMPPSMFEQAGPAYDPPCQRFLLTSRALLPAAQLVAEEHQVSTSTVVLAATAAVVARWTGHQTVTISTLVNNRFQDGHQHMVATLAQQGLFGLDVPAAVELPALIGPAWLAAMRGYRHAYYDPDQLWARRDQVSLDRGSLIDPYCCFNDVRRAPDLAAGTDPAALRQAAAATRSQTTVVELAPLPRMHCRFCLQVSEQPGATTLRLTADTRYLPPDDIPRFLRETEASVLELLN